MSSLNKAAAEIKQGCGRGRGLRILHVSDLHNRLRGFRLVKAVVRELNPDLVINTGDLSGIGTRLEALAMKRLCQFGPQVFAPGNHDSDQTAKGLVGAGATVLGEPRLVEVNGVSVWGYRDPNETPMLGLPYDVSLCKQTAGLYRPPLGHPVVVAVHHRAMVRPHPGITVVLSGHIHSPKVERYGDAISLRCGSSGGGRPFGGPLQLAVVDVTPNTLEPQAIWLISAGEKVEVAPVDLEQMRA